MALFSLSLLVLAILLGFFRKMNAGLICIAFSLVLGRVAGIPDKAIIAGFSYNLFLTLLGVTYLFSLAQNNGTLKLIALKVVALAGKRTYLVPIFIFVFSIAFLLVYKNANRTKYSKRAKSFLCFNYKFSNKKAKNG